MNEQMTAIIRSLQPALQDPAEIRAALARPTIITRPVMVAKPASRVARERQAVGLMRELVALMGGEPDNALAVVGSMAEQGVAAIVATVNQAVIGAGAEMQIAALRLSTALLAILSAHQAEGLPWPLPADFGAECYPSTESIPGPSAWESAFPGVPLPDHAAILSAMKQD